MRSILMCVALSCLAIWPRPASAQESEHPELEQLMADFVRGWRENDRELLSRVVALDEGRITWVSGEEADARATSMTFRAAVDRDRSNPDYGVDGWRILDIDVVDDRLAVIKLEVLETDVTNIDYMVCYRVGREWRIVSNTFVIRRD